MALNSSGRPDPVEIDPDVAANYAELYRQGREWSTMADEAERMGDKRLAAHLREQDSKTERTSAPVDRKPAAGAKQESASRG